MISRPVRIGSKALLIGGFTLTALSLAVDIYDAGSDTWSITTMPRPRTSFTTAVSGTRVFIAGGFPATDLVDVYDTALGSWSVETLSRPRDAVTAAAVGNYVLFAGGRILNPLPTFFDTVDIYDANAGTWSVAQLSRARSNIHAESVGSKAVFAGGTDGTPINVVDIFDANSASWSTAQLSVRRFICTSVTVDSKALFIGGGHIDPATTLPIISRVVDVYDSATDVWSSGNISEWCASHRGVTAVGGKAFVAGQVRAHATSIFDFLTVVDVYDASAGVWYSTDLSQARANLSAVAVGTKAMFAGGLSLTSGISDMVDIYEELGTEYCVANPNSTGLGAEMFMTGSKRLSDNSLDLRAGPIPDTLSLFVYSPAAQVVPFGDGYSCVGSPLFRLEPPMPAEGQMAAKRVLTSQLNFVSGTLYFQCFYRDPAAGGTGLNSSNGYAIDFVP